MMEVKVTLRVSDEFERQVKRFVKKYKSFIDDYSAFIASIKANPYQGVDLGGGKRKVRMAVASKGKGKSGGLRIITYMVVIESPNDLVVNLTRCTIKTR